MVKLLLRRKYFHNNPMVNIRSTNVIEVFTQMKEYCFRRCMTLLKEEVDGN
jgi:hypothetical protein